MLTPWRESELLILTVRRAAAQWQTEGGPEPKRKHRVRVLVVWGSCYYNTHFDLFNTVVFTCRLGPEVCRPEFDMISFDLSHMRMRTSVFATPTHLTQTLNEIDSFNGGRATLNLCAVLKLLCMLCVCVVVFYSPLCRPLPPTCTYFVCMYIYGFFFL